jgi:hypothetical protein
MTGLRPLPLILALVPLAGCAEIADMRGTTPFATASVPATLTQEVGADRALARLPDEAGPVVIVTERRETDRLTQTIALSGDAATPGTNHIRVVAATRDPERSRRTTEEAITAEMEAEFAGLDMRPSSRLITAAGGPIGLATGRSATGATCVYAWQEIDARPGRGRGGVFGSETVDVSVRVRLCRHDLGEDRAIALVEGLRLRADVVPLGGWRTAGTSGVDALASAGYGATSAAATRQVTPVIAASASVSATRTEVRRPVVARAETSARRPAPVGAPVPLPTSTPPVASAATSAPAIVAAPLARATPAAPAAPSAAVPAVPLPTGG